MPRVGDQPRGSVSSGAATMDDFWRWAQERFGQAQAKDATLLTPLHNPTTLES
jgi:hypothetical protein